MTALDKLSCASRSLLAVINAVVRFHDEQAELEMQQGSTRCRDLEIAYSDRKQEDERPLMKETT